eukprot:5120644-Pyramimonas_sp.AAC.1
MSRRSAPSHKRTPRARAQAALPACSRPRRRKETPVHEAQPEAPAAQVTRHSSSDSNSANASTPENQSVSAAPL